MTCFHDGGRFGKEFGEWIFQTDFAVLYQHHDRGCGELFADGSGLKDGFGLYGNLQFDVRQAVPLGAHGLPARETRSARPGMCCFSISAVDVLVDWIGGLGLARENSHKEASEASLRQGGVVSFGTPWRQEISKRSRKNSMCRGKATTRAEARIHSRCATRPEGPLFHGDAYILEFFRSLLRKPQIVSREAHCCRRNSLEARRAHHLSYVRVLCASHLAGHLRKRIAAGGFHLCCGSIICLVC